MGTVCPRRLSFSGFNVLMGTLNPEKDNLLGQAITIQTPVIRVTVLEEELFVSDSETEMF